MRRAGSLRPRAIFRSKLRWQPAYEPSSRLADIVSSISRRIAARWAEPVSFASIDTVCVKPLPIRDARHMRSPTSLEAMQELKDRLDAALDRHAQALIHFGNDIFTHPEIGFREGRTASRIAEALARLGLDIEEGLALTGVRARLRGAKAGPTICVMGELDGLPV